MPAALLATLALLSAFAPGPLRAQSASFSGTVIVEGTNRPLENAEIAFPALKLTTRSDKAGNFQITGLPAGKLEVVVRLPGYEQFTAEITFRAGQKVEADVELAPITTKLAKVDVRDTMRSKDLRLAEFEERRLTPGSGRFITADVFEKMSGSRMTDILLGRIPGVRRVNLSNSSVRPLATTRGGGKRALMVKSSDCYVQIIVNNVVMYNMDMSTGFYDIDQLSPAEVLGVEFYTVASQPLKYAGTGGNCGTVVIWTK